MLEFSISSHASFSIRRKRQIARITEEMSRSSDHRAIFVGMILEAILGLPVISRVASSSLISTLGKAAAICLIAVCNA